MIWAVRDTYLASELGNHDGLAVGRMPLLDVGDHALRGNVVVVNAVEVGLEDVLSR